MKDYLECQHGIARVLKSLWSIACRYSIVRVRFRPLSGDTDARFTPFDLALKSAKWVAIVFASERTTLAWLVLRMVQEAVSPKGAAERRRPMRKYHAVAVSWVGQVW